LRANYSRANTKSEVLFNFRKRQLDKINLVPLFITIRRITRTRKIQQQILPFELHERKRLDDVVIENVLS